MGILVPLTTLRTPSRSRMIGWVFQPDPMQWVKESFRATGWAQTNVVLSIKMYERQDNKEARFARLKSELPSDRRTTTPVAPDPCMEELALPTSRALFVTTRCLIHKSPLLSALSVLLANTHLCYGLNIYLSAADYGEPLVYWQRGTPARNWPRVLAKEGEAN